MIDIWAQQLWDYLAVRQEPTPADALFVLCSNDLRVADYAAELYHAGMAPLIIFSGGIAHQDDLLRTPWEGTEAAVFGVRAQELGVPESVLLLEEQSRHTGENITCTQMLLKEKNLQVKSVLAVQKPFMMRRVRASMAKLWPEVHTRVVAPDCTFQTYPNDAVPKDTLIHLMVGEVQRMCEYPRRGYQAEEEMPPSVWDAYEQLCAAGYTQHLLTLA